MRPLGASRSNGGRQRVLRALRDHRRHPAHDGLAENGEWWGWWGWGWRWRRSVQGAPEVAVAFGQSNIIASFFTDCKVGAFLRDAAQPGRARPEGAIATGVTVNPDGSVLLTPGEWAGISQAPCRIGSRAERGCRARTGTGTGTGTAHRHASSRRRRPVRVNRDEQSSSSEDERPLASRRCAAAVEAPRSVEQSESGARRTMTDAPPAATARRRRCSNLSADELASILDAIGRVEESKATACQDAQNWCATSVRTARRAETATRRSGGTWPQRIFDNGPATTTRRLLGQEPDLRHLQDDANPRTRSTACAAPRALRTS